MSKRNEEEALLDIFLRFLRDSEGSRYEVVDVDVKNQVGNKNFDYLLRDGGSAGTMALEITLLADSDDSIKQTVLRDCVRQRIRAALMENSEHLAGGIVISMPYKFSASKRTIDAEAHSVTRELLEVAMVLNADEQRQITTAIGAFNVQRVGDAKFVLFASFDGPGWSTHWHDCATMLSTLVGRLSVKNEQLNTRADRRVLLVGRFSGIIDRDAIAEALGALRGSCNNIDELYVCYNDREVERYW